MRHFWWAAALALPVSAGAQGTGEDPDEADSVSIILTQLSDDYYFVVRSGLLPSPAGEITYPVSTISDLPFGTGARLENRLRDEAGLAQFRRSDARSAHPTSQGLTLRGLGGNAASRALVTLDGVPQADPFGGWVPWSAFDSINLAGARLVRGGGGGGDGPSALAGTLALYSAMANGVEAALAGGSRTAIDGAASLGSVVGAGDVSLDARYARGDGFVPVVSEQRGAADRAAPYRHYGAGVRARFDTGRNGRIELAVRGFADRRDRGVDFTASRVDGLDASIRYLLDPDAPDRWQAMLLAYVQLRELDTGFASVTADRSRAAPVLDQRVPATGVGTRIELRPPLGGAHPLRLGVDWRRVTGETQEGFAFAGNTPQRRRLAGGSADTIGGFAEWRDDISGDVSATLSARADHWRLGAGRRTERLVGGALLADDRFAPRSGWAGTGRAGLRWDGDGIALRTAAYSGWRLPTLNELYRPFRVGADATAANENLRPERLWGVEAGAEWNPYDLSLSLTGYWNRLDRAIANVTVARGPGTFPGAGFVGAAGRFAQRQNLDAIIAKGVEVAAQQYVGAVTLRASYAFTDARVRASGVAAALDGQRPAQVARHSASVSADADLADVRLGATLRYIGAQNEDDLGALRLGDALTLDMRVAWDVGEVLTIEARAENLADVVVPAAISSSGIIERAAPRSLWLGLRARF